MIKLAFRGKRELNFIFKDHDLLDSVEHWNWRHCSQKTYVFLNFVEKYVRLILKWKKKINVVITIIAEHA